ncbi:MAG: diacylglycerol/lipid kinase family protein [Planctomycetota bacterium]
MSYWGLLYNAAAHSAQRRRGALETRASALARAHASAPEVRWIPIADLDRVTEMPARLIAIGGDGTVNAAASWLARKADAAALRNAPHPAIELGIVPVGTGNNLARGLALSLDPDAALEVALGSGPTTPLDALRFSSIGDEREWLCLQSAALGFPARVAARYDSWRRRAWFRALARPTGPYIYRVLAALELFAQARRQWRRRGLVEIAIGDASRRESAMALFINNERSLGGNFIPCPAARIDDGAFDYCLVRTTRVRDYAHIFSRVIKGTHVELTTVVACAQSAAPVRFQFSTPLTLLVDGDLHKGVHGIEVRVIPGCFRVRRASKKSSAGPSGRNLPS